MGGPGGAERERALRLLFLCVSSCPGPALCKLASSRSAVCPTWGPHSGPFDLPLLYFRRLFPCLPFNHHRFGLLFPILSYLTASLTWWTWVWASSWRWWWTGRPGVPQSMGSQTVWHDWVNWTELNFIIEITVRELRGKQTELGSVFGQAANVRPHTRSPSQWTLNFVPGVYRSGIPMENQTPRMKEPQDLDLHSPLPKRIC